MRSLRACTHAAVPAAWSRNRLEPEIVSGHYALGSAVATHPFVPHLLVAFEFSRITNHRLRFLGFVVTPTNRRCFHRNCNSVAVDFATEPWESSSGF